MLPQPPKAEQLELPAAPTPSASLPLFDRE
jgi:hypothetical protein